MLVRGVFARGVVAAVVATTCLVGVASRASAAAPLTNWSYYVLSTTPATYQTLGCNQAQFDQAHSQWSEVFLDFGAQNNTTQVRLTNLVTISLATAESLAENYISGYDWCSNGTTATFLTVGVNNDGTAVGTATGQKWADTMTHVYDWAASLGSFNKVFVAASADFEAWSGPHATGAYARQWLAGFDSHNVRGRYMLNFGSADGCSWTSHTNQACNNGWNQADYYFVSWGKPNYYVAPEIYNTNTHQTGQWYQIDLWGVYHGSEGKIYFDGPLDQYTLDPTTNTSAAAYGQLYYFINSDPLTSVGGDFQFSFEVHRAT